MTRKARIKAPNQIYSVVTRVNNSEFTFEDFSLCEAFLAHLKKTKDLYQFKLFGFVLMSSHIHLLIQPNDEIADISRIMCYLNGKFSQTFNMTYKRKGHFWMQRFSSKIVETGVHLANTLIYFALNPVRANMTNNPLKHTYSSIHNITEQKFSDLLDKLPAELEAVLMQFLQEGEFLKILEKCKRILKQFSFNLRKTEFEQRFKNFVGSKQFVKNCNQQFQLKTTSK